MYIIHTDIHTQSFYITVYKKAESILSKTHISYSTHNIKFCMSLNIKGNRMCVKQSVSMCDWFGLLTASHNVLQQMLLGLVLS
jgi:hypothetical protein